MKNEKSLHVLTEVQKNLWTHEKPTEANDTSAKQGCICKLCIICSQIYIRIIWKGAPDLTL